MPMENTLMAKVPTNRPKMMFDWVFTLNDDSRSQTEARPVTNEAMMALNRTTSSSLMKTPNRENLFSSGASGSKSSMC